MYSIDRFRECVSQDVMLDDVDTLTKGLEALTVTPEWHQAALCTNSKISEFHKNLAERRTEKKGKANKRFVDEEYVAAICGEVTVENSRSVQKIVDHPQFMGNLCRDDVATLLKNQTDKVGILYIESQWVPTSLRESNNQLKLEAKLFFSFANGSGGVEHIALTPDYVIEKIIEKQGASFLQVDRTILAIEAFQGFSAYNLLRMQTVACKSDALTLFTVANSITQDELKPFITIGDRRSRMNTDRYSDIVPYVCNCVGTGIDGQDINGSYIWAGKRLFITCQGPKEETREAFWQTVLYHGTVTVIALGPPVEGHCEKFDDSYFTFDEALCFEDGTCIKRIEDNIVLEWTFTPKNSADSMNHQIITRTFECTSPKWGKHIVRHHHCSTWRDMKGGDPRILTELVRCINEGNEAPVIIHCSAGVGRTGTLVTAYELQHAQNHASILTTLIRLRHQRHGLIQNVQQMEMLLSFIRPLE